MHIGAYKCKGGAMSDDDFSTGSDWGAGSDSGSGQTGDSYTETTTSGWLEGLGSSLTGILIGIVLMVGAGVLLFWNEGRTVKTAKALDEAARTYVELSGPAVEPANQGKLVHVVGDLQPIGMLADGTFSVTVSGIRLRRTVEIYQWQQKESTEKTKNLGGSTTKQTTYTYSQVWEDHLIDSSSFKRPEGHSNPRHVAFQSQSVNASQVKMGAFSLPVFLIEKLTNFEPLPVESAMLQALAPPLREKAQISDNWCYFGNPGSPRVGDMRVKFGVVKPGTVSVIARQLHATFEPYTAQNGKTVAVITPGVHSAESMIAGEKSENRLICWILRGVGMILMCIGVYLLLNPIVALLNLIPFLGDIAAVGAGLIAVIVGLVLSLVIGAVAWFSYRPILSIGLAGCAVLALVMLRKSGGRSKQAG